MRISKTGFLSSILFILLFQPVFAQHESHTMGDSSKKKSAAMDMDNMDMDDMGGMPMSHAFSRNLPMNRNGSGTGWLPDASPMFATMKHSNGWMYMVHGSLFLRYNNQDYTKKGSRGNDKFDAPNWLMFMGQKPVGKKGLFHFNVMLSLDPLTVGGAGYPLLFQSGEAYKGNPIVDRQHPHDLFSELSVSYAYALSSKSDIFLYAAYPGEPALGPVAFMHRPSALDNPDAPLSHHWADATHISFGVVTAGFRYGKFKLEQSLFTGREPDDHRYNFDKPRFDSWSGRISFNPSPNWALQVSTSYLKSPEVLHADENVNRTTASAIYSKTLADKSTFNATALWGVNKTAGHDGENAVLLEASWRKKKLALYGRYEYVQKSDEELNLNASSFDNQSVFPVNALTVGFNYDLLRIKNLKMAGGAQTGFYHADANLDKLYGRNPMSFEVYLRFYPGMMRM